MFQPLCILIFLPAITFGIEQRQPKICPFPDRRLEAVEWSPHENAWYALEKVREDYSFIRIDQNCERYRIRTLPSSTNISSPLIRKQTLYYVDTDSGEVRLKYESQSSSGDINVGTEKPNDRSIAIRQVEEVSNQAILIIDYIFDEKSKTNVISTALQCPKQTFGKVNCKCAKFVKGCVVDDETDEYWFYTNSIKRKYREIYVRPEINRCHYKVHFQQNSSFIHELKGSSCSNPKKGTAVSTLGPVTGKLKKILKHRDEYFVAQDAQPYLR